MAIGNDDASLEDVSEQSKSRHLEGFKSWAGNKLDSGLEAIGEGVEAWGGAALDLKDKVAGTDFTEIIPSPIEVFNKLKDVGAGLQKGSFDDFDLLGNKTLTDPLQTVIAKPTEEDIKISKELNSLNALDMGIDMGIGLVGVAKDVILGSELSGKIKNGIDEKQFYTDTNKFQTNIEDYNKKIFELENKPEFNNLITLDNNAVAEYLKLNNITEVTDVEAFENFRQEYILKLDGIQQRNIIEQYKSYTKQAAELMKSLKLEEKSYKDYLTNNVDGGEEEFNRVIKNQQDSAKDSKYLSLIGNIYNQTEGKVDTDVQALGLEKISDFSGFNNLKDAIIDDAAVDKQYELSILGMKDLPNNEFLYQKMKEVNGVTYKFNIDFMKNYISERNNLENSGLSEVDLRNKTLNKTRVNLSDKDKGLYAQKESLITSISQLRESTQLMDRIGKGNMLDSVKAGLDLISYAGVTGQKIFDQAFSYTGEGVPHYVKQETRNLIMSDEGMGKKFISLFTYNPDAILSTIASGRLIALPAKGLNKALKVAEKGIMKIPGLNVGFGKGTLQFFGKGSRAFAAGQLYSAGTDPIMDNVMVEAPTNTTETFNQISSILFDVAPMSVSQGFKEGSSLGKKSMNSIYYNFLTSKNTKEAIDDFRKGIKIKTGQKISGGQAKEILDNLVTPLYSSFYNPKEVKKIFNSKGGLYNFLSDNVSRMEEAGIKELVTEKGLGLSLNKGFSVVTGIPEKDMLNIKEAFINKTSLEDGVQRQFAQAHFDKLKEFYSGVLEHDKGINGIQIDKKFSSDEEFIKLKGQASGKLQLMADAKTEEVFNKALEEFNNITQEAQIKFASNLKVKNYVDVTDFNTGNVTKVYLDDDFSEKNLLDMVKDGTVQRKEKDGLKKYSVRGSDLDVVELQYNNYIKDNKKEIDDFVTKYTGKAGESLSAEEVNKQIKNLLFGRAGKNKDVTTVPFAKGMDFNDSREILEDLSKVMINIFNGFLGKDLAGVDVIRKKPIYLNKELSGIPNEPYFLSGKKLSKYLGEDDSYMNISYGLFNDTKTEKLTNAMYLTMGKKVQRNDVIKEGASGMNKKGIVSMDKLLNEHNKIKKILLNYGFKGGVFNIDEGLEKLTILYSAGREQTSELFIKGKLDKKKIINYLVHETKIIDEDIHNFIYELFKDAGEGYSMILEPMVNNIAYMYAKNKHIIDEVIKRQATQSNFNEVFSGLLLSKNLVNDMGDLLLKRTSISDEFKKISDKLAGTLEDNWKEYRKKLELKKINIELNNSQLIKWRDENHGLFTANKKLSEDGKQKILARRNILEDEINKNLKIVENIDAQLRRKKNPFEETQVSSYMADLLRTKANNFSLLTNTIDESLKDTINKLEIEKGNLEDIGKINKDIIKGINKLNDTDTKEISNFILLAKEGDKIKELQSIILNTPDGKVKTLMEDVLQLSNMSFKDKSIVFEEDIIKELDYAYNDKILLDYNEAINKNPISTYLGGFLNNNDINQDVIFTKGILDYFSKLDGVEVPYNLDSYNLYKTSNSFKGFVDSLTVKEFINEHAKYELDGKAVGYLEMEANYKKIINDISNSVQIDVMKKGTITNVNGELIDLVIDDVRIRNKFVAISRLKDYNEVISDKLSSSIKTRVLDYGTTKPQEMSSYMNILKDKSYDEQVLQIDNMIEAGMDIGLIKKVDFGKFGYVDGFENKITGEIIEYVRNINTTINKHNEKYVTNIKAIMLGRKIGELSDLEKKEVISNYVKISRKPSEALERFSKIFNEEKTDYTYLTGKGKEQTLENSKLIEESGLKDFYEGGFYFAGSFGDKDSLYTLYKAPKDLIDGLGAKNLKQVRELSKELYRIHYSYSNGYIKPDAKFKTFDEFKKYLLDNKGKKLQDSIKLIKDNTEEICISIKDIKKRETFNMSNYSLAGGDKTPIVGLIVDVQLKDDIGLPKNLFKLSDEDFIKTIKDYIEKKGKYADTIGQIIEADKNIQKQKQGIKDTFYNDLTDGTAWSTKDVGEKLLSYMGFGSAKYVREQIIDKGIVREIKAHVYGDVNKGGSKVRYGGKHLVNIPNVIKDNKGNTLKETYVTGIESAKLKGGAVFKDTNPELFKDVTDIIEIDGVTYDIIGKIDGMDMSFYKNASSTLLKDHKEITLAASVQAVLSEKAAARTEEFQMLEIDKAFQKLIAKINNPTLQLDSWSEIDKAVNRVVNEFTVGLGSSSVLGGKLSEFMTRVNGIIKKSQIEGQSVYIRQSSLDIKPNEVIMSNKSSLVKQIREETKVKLYPDTKSYKDLSVEEKEIVNNNLYTVGYRYPVPSKYNLGAYKILIGEDLALKDKSKFGEFEHMGSKQVVPHPLATYLKLQGDNDGDHIFFISMLGEWGDVVAKDILGRDLDSDLFKELKDGVYTIKNDFIIVDQVDKESIISDPNTTLLSSRIASLDAKSSIGVVSATGRTIKILGQMLEKYNIDKSNGNTLFIKDIKDNKGKSNITTLTFNQLKEVLPDLKTDKSFSSYYDSLLQLTLDFGNSNASSFDELWFTRLITNLISSDITEESIKEIKTYAEWLSNGGKINVDGELKQVAENVIDISSEQKDILFTIFETMDGFITPMSTRYGDSLAAYKMDGIMRDKNSITKINTSNVLKNYYYPIIGSKRNIYDKVIDKYGKILSSLNKTDDINFIISNILDNNKNSFSKKYKKIMETANQEGFLYKKVKQENYESITKGIATYKSNLDIEEKNIIQKFEDIIDKIKLSENKKEQALLRKELFKKENINLLDKYPIAKTAIVLKAYFGGDNKLINYLTNKEKVDYLKITDTSLRNKLTELNEAESTKDIMEELGIDNTIGYIIGDKEKYKEHLNDTLDELTIVIDNTKVSTIDDKIELDKNTIKLQEIETRIKELENVSKTNVIETIKDTPKIDYSDTDYVLPKIKQDLVQLDYKETEKLLFDVASTATKSENLVMLKTAEMLFRHVPDLLDIDSTIRDLINVTVDGKNLISEATAVHINHFGDWTFLKNKKGLNYLLKNSGIDKYITMGREVQYSLIRYDNGLYTPKPIEEAIQYLKRKLATPEGEELLKNQDFIDAMINYSNEVIKPVTDTLTRLDAQTGYKIFNKYKGDTKISLVNDVLEAHKSDSQLALKIFNINSKKQFEKLLKNRGVKSTGTLRTMLDGLFKKPQDGIDKFTGLLKSIHYGMTYGAGSTFITQNGFMSGIAQLLPNYAEVKAYYRANIDNMGEAYKSMKEFGLLDSEDVMMLGTSIDKDLTDASNVNALLTRAMNVIGVKNIKGNKVTSLAHMLVTNPLAVGDLPVEEVRKLVAINQAMEQYGIKGFKELNEKVNRHGNQFLGRFRTRVSMNFADSGGGVVSSSRIYRDTTFHHLDNYFDNVVVKMLNQTVGYLMGWSYHKQATLIEKEMAFVTGIKDMCSLNFKSGMAHIHDAIEFNSMMFRQMMYATGVYLKLSKYEKDNNDKVSFWEFQKAFNNSIVSFEVLFGRYIDGMEAAYKQDAGLGEQAKYTTYNILKSAYRVFKQSEFVTTMYNHYEMRGLEGKADILESFEYATNTHYTGYMRFQGITQAKDVYNSLIAQGTTGYLLLGGNTEEEELFNDVIRGNTFSSYKQDGFIGALLNHVNVFKNTKGTSGFNITGEMAKEFKDILIKDEHIKRLISGGQLGTDEGDYNLESLIGKPGTKMTQSQFENIKNLYYKISNYLYKTTGVNEVVDEKRKSKYQVLLNSSINEALKGEGITIDDFANYAKSPEDFLRVLSVLETKYNIAHPIALSILIEQERKKLQTELYKKRKLQGINESMGDLEYADINRTAMIKYQDYLNMNSDFVFQVIDSHASTYYGDIFDKYKDKFKDAGYAITDAVNYVNNSYLIGKVVSKDTSVTKLHSRYAIVLKSLKANDDTVSIVNGFLQGMFDLPYLSQKEKLANAAAALTGLNKATFKFLEEGSEEFNALTTNSKKLLSNWMFKINKEAIDFDSKILANDLNRKAGSGYSSAYNKMLYPRYKSGSFGGARPNFSKQFQPLKQMINGKIPYVEKDYEEFLKQNNPYTKDSFVNPLKFPIMKKYNALLLQAIFRGYQSKGEIKNKSQIKVDNYQKKLLKMKVPKKSMKVESKTLPRKKPKTVSKGLNPSLPLGTQING